MQIKSYSQQLIYQDRLDEMAERERKASQKVVCHGVWVNGKIIPERDEWRYIDEEGNWRDQPILEKEIK